MIKSTFSILFIIQKGKPKKDGRVPIMARITVNKEMVHLSTRFDVFADRWLAKECRTVGLTKEDKQLNSMLEDYRVLIKNKYNELFMRGEVITATKLKSLITSKSDKCIRLVELFEQFNADYKQMVGKSTTHKTYTRYVLTLTRLQEFMTTKYRVTDIPLSDITPKFIKDFDLYLRTCSDNSNNYATKFIQRFRTVYNVAKDNGWVTTDPFANHKLKFDKVDRGYLSQQELNAIMQKKFESDRLTLVRDLFVFSCYTGLAYIDLCNLTKDCLVKGDDGNMWITTHRQKTGVPVRIRLLDIPLRILERYATNSAKLLSIPSNQKVNDYLKEIGAMCGINKKMTFHLARHTFATTITLSNGVPIETVSKLLGHTNIRTTQIYARITDTKISRDMDILAQKLNNIQISI